MCALACFWTDTQGQDLVEYTLLLFFVVTAAAGIFLGMPDSMAVIWSKAQSHVDAAADTPGL